MILKSIYYPSSRKDDQEKRRIKTINKLVLVIISTVYFNKELDLLLETLNTFPRNSIDAVV